MSDSVLTTDYLILGQGLAGTLLSYRLSRLGINHYVVDRGHATASSNAAAGIVNPVTGRRFVKTWHIEALLKGLSIYEELEKLLGVKLLNQVTIYRDLSDTAVLNQWDMRRSDRSYAPYMGAPLQDKVLPIQVPNLVGPTLQAAQVNLRELIIGYRGLLKSNACLFEQELSIDDAQFKSGHWQLGGFAVRRIIDCTGAEAMSSSTWAKLPWRGTKGEAFRFLFSALPRQAAVKMKHFICPIGTSKEVWLGGTNQDHYSDVKPTELATERLSVQAKAFGIELPDQLEHLVAIRPTVSDRRPLVGEHPYKPGLWICNGFGTKGTSLGPYCTQQLQDRLVFNVDLDPEIDIAKRFSE